MRRKRSTQLGEKSLSIALFFVLLVVLLVGLSVALKIFLLFKAAKFDGQHQFILELHAPSQNQLLSFDPDMNSAVVLSLKGQVASPFGNSLGIPEDGVVTVSARSDSLYTFVQNLLFHPPSHSPFNIVDRIRFFLFVNNIKPTSISEVEWTVSNQTDDQKLTQLFTDHTAYTENLSVAIVNASGVAGLGNKVATYFSHIGVNVISVTSSQQQVDPTAIVYSGKEGYTVDRLARIFSKKPKASTAPMLSDITVTLGKESANAF